MRSRRSGTGAGFPGTGVVNARGEVSERSDGSPMGAVQRARLRREGVRFDERGRISFETLPVAAEGPLTWRSARLRDRPL